MSAGIQNHDIVVRRKDDGFHVAQVLGGRPRHLEGPFAGRAEAEIRALALAEEHSSDAWVEEAPDIHRLL